MEFDLLLTRVGLMDLIVILSRPIGIQRREPNLRDFVKKKKKKKKKEGVGLYLNNY